MIYFDFWFGSSSSGCSAVKRDKFHLWIFVFRLQGIGSCENVRNIQNKNIINR